VKIRVHLSTYADRGDGTFTVDVSRWRAPNPGEVEREVRATDCRDKPNASPTTDDVLALYRALYPAPHDVAAAEASS
jgi:hypothetical protein